MAMFSHSEPQMDTQEVDKKLTAAQLKDKLAALYHANLMSKERTIELLNMCDKGDTVEPERVANEIEANKLAWEQAKETLRDGVCQTIGKTLKGLYPFLKEFDTAIVSIGDGRYNMEMFMPMKEDTYDSVVWKIIKQLGTLDEGNLIRLDGINFYTRKKLETGYKTLLVPDSKIAPATAKELTAEEFAKGMHSVREECNHYPELCLHIEFRLYI